MSCAPEGAVADASASPEPLLQVRDLRVRMGPRGRGRREVLRGVDLDLAAGECLAVVGSSGAGKSVLARTLLGLTSDEGAQVTAETCSLAGRPVLRGGRRGRRRLRGREVSLVLQDALQSLDPLRSIGAEVGETLAVRGVPRRERTERVRAALVEAGLLSESADEEEARTLLRRRSGELSGGMRQRALIASALVGGAPLMITDEPTTALDATIAARVLDLLGRLRDEGTGVLLISHDLAAVSRVADRIAVIEDGRLVEQGPAGRILRAPQHRTTQALLAAVPQGPKPGDPIRPGRVLLEARGLERRYGSGGTAVTAVAELDLTVRAGEILGVVGESGSGKSTLARLLAGFEAPDAGTVQVPAGAEPPRIRLVPQDPAGSFDPRLSVERILRHAAGEHGPDPAEVLARVALEPALLGRRPARLSGGQRQRVAIARALAGRPDLLICDEPVSALDVVTQAGILDLLRDLQRREDVGILVISHDLAVVRALADRTAVMRAGRVLEIGPTERLHTDPQHPFTRELIAARSLTP